MSCLMNKFMLEYIKIIKEIPSVLKLIKESKKIIKDRFPSTIEYFDLYNVVKNPDFGYKNGKKLKIKNVFFSQFATMQTPTSKPMFDLCLGKKNLILNLDGVFNSQKGYLHLLV